MYKLEYHKRNFFNTAIADIFRAIDGGSRIGAFTLTFCLIDHLAWLEFGHSTDIKGHFARWIQKRLRPHYIFYENYGEELYSVRCGLVHTYGPSKEILNQKFEGYKLYFEYVGMHLQKVNNGTLKLCLYSLLTDVVFAAHLFFEELEKEANIEIFERLQKQIVILNVDPPVLYKDMHRTLSVFDCQDKITLHSIRSCYTETILYPPSNA